MNKKYNVQFFLVFLLSASGNLNAKNIPSNLDRTASNLISNFFQKRHSPGFSVSVGCNNKLFWSKGMGYADLEQKVLIDPSKTKFRVGSIAKPYTAFALAKLIEAGKIDLEKNINFYVPDFPKKQGPITIRQLAAHLSGIRHYKNNEPFSNTKYETVSDALSIFKNDPLVHTPGEKWTYSSYGYNLLSAAMESATKTDFLTLMDETVFKPLGMSQTTADKIDEIIPDRGRYYTFKENEILNEREVDSSYKWASGGFISTTDDMVLFGLAHLNNKQIKASSLEMLWTPQKTTAGEKTEYGLGWNILKHENELWIGHGGGSIGGTTQFWIFPEHSLSIAASSNLSRFDYGDFMIDLVSLFLKQDACNNKS